MDHNRDSIFFSLTTQYKYVASANSSCTHNISTFTKDSQNLVSSTTRPIYHETSIAAMPVINLGSLGRFTLQRLGHRDELSPSTRARQVEHEILDSPPPPYCAIPGTFDTTHTASTYAPTTPIPLASALLAMASSSGALRGRPVSPQKPRCRIIQFRRFIVEAIALNLDADFRALNAVLYPDANSRCSNSILTPVERADLLDLARLVQRMHGEVKRGQILDPQDKNRISKAILEPYWEITWGCNPHFVFDLISRLSPERTTGYIS
jgi:hypothetical protein